MNKANNLICKVISALFVLMMLGILLVLMWDSNIDYACINEKLLKNSVCTIIYFVIFGIIVFIIKLTKLRTNVLCKDSLVAIICVIMAAIIFLLGTQYLFDTGWDLGLFVRPNAERIAMGNYSEIDNIYLSMYPNNVAITCVLAAYIKLVLHFIAYENLSYALLFLNSVFFAISGFFTYKIAKNVLKRTEWVAFTFIMYFLLVGFSPWVQVVYTDSIGLLFVTIAVYFLSQYIKSKNIIFLWMFLVLGCVGYYIKPQIFIVVIAAMIIILFGMITDIKKNAVCVMGLALVLFICSQINMYIKRDTIFDLNPEMRMGVAHFFMMGLNSDTKGVYSTDDLGFSLGFENNVERDKADWEKAQERISEYGIKGTADLYISKLLTDYNDGTFAWNKEGGFYLKMYDVGHNMLGKWLKDYYYDNGSRVKVFYTVQQILWLGVLALSLFSGFNGDNKIVVIMQLTIIGLTIFEVVFEARARYLFSYVPLYIVLAAVGVERIMRMIYSE